MRHSMDHLPRPEPVYRLPTPGIGAVAFTRGRGNVQLRPTLIVPCLTFTG